VTQARRDECRWIQHLRIAILLNERSRQPVDEHTRRFNAVRDAFESNPALAFGNVHRPGFSDQGKPFEIIQLELSVGLLRGAIDGDRQTTFPRHRHISRGRGERERSQHHQQRSKREVHF